MNNKVIWSGLLNCQHIKWISVDNNTPEQHPPQSSSNLFINQPLGQKMILWPDELITLRLLNNIYLVAWNHTFTQYYQNKEQQKAIQQKPFREFVLSWDIFMRTSLQMEITTDPKNTIKAISGLITNAMDINEFTKSLLNIINSLCIQGMKRWTRQVCPVYLHAKKERPNLYSDTGINALQREFQIQ